LLLRYAPTPPILKMMVFASQAIKMDKAPKRVRYVLEMANPMGCNGHQARRTLRMVSRAVAEAPMPKRPIRTQLRGNGFCIFGKVYSKALRLR